MAPKPRRRWFHQERGSHLTLSRSELTKAFQLVAAMGDVKSWRAGRATDSLQWPCSAKRRHNDLKRQLLMSTDDVELRRIDSVAKRLHEINPHVSVEMVRGNVNESDVVRFSEQADILVSASPLFRERLLLNRRRCASVSR